MPHRLGACTEREIVGLPFAAGSTGRQLPCAGGGPEPGTPMAAAVARTCPAGAGRRPEAEANDKDHGDLGIAGALRPC